MVAKRWGFDVDGVLARFDQAYQDLTVRVTGKNLFTGPVPAIGATTWDWPEAVGYTKKEMGRVWDAIKASPDFWRKLPTTKGMEQLLVHLPSLAHDDIYFITARPGHTAKKQTEAWLHNRGFYGPTVLMSKAKGAVAKALNLDVYIDDKFENALDVVLESPNTRSYLLHQAHNAGVEVTGIIRVNSVAEMFEREGL